MCFKHAAGSMGLLCLVLCLGACPGVARGQVIEPQLGLRSADGMVGDELGWSVAIDAMRIAVGAWHDGDNGANSGSVYLFDAISGVQLMKLLPDDGDTDDVFGVSLDLRGDVVAVGARDNDDSGSNSGSAYVFDAVSGTQIAKLVAQDAAAGDRFGRAVAIGDGIVCVGSPLDDATGADSGSVYVFDATTGVQIRKIVPDDASAGDRFGFAMGIDDGVLAVCAYHDNVHGTSSGSVYLFDVASGTQLMKFAPDDGGEDHQFGRTVAIDDGLVAVGAESDELGTRAGSAYVFDAATGAQVAKLLPDDGVAGDSFGSWVRIDRGMVVVGSAFHSDALFGTGAAYLFDARTGQQLRRLRRDGAASLDFFGSSVDIFDGEIVVGALGVDGIGAAEVFGVGCRSDLSGDRSLSFIDVSAFVGAFVDGDADADLTDDGRLDFFDVSMFLQLYQMGCD